MDIDKHGDEMLSALEGLPHVEYQISTYAFSCDLLDKAANSFAIGGNYKYPLWDNLKDWVGVNYRFSWEWLGDLLNKREVTLFFEPDDDWRMFTFKNGGVLPEILNNCYGFVFYVIDRDCSFLFTYNDHDNLIACGKAMNWLRNYHVIELENVKMVESSSLP